MKARIEIRNDGSVYLNDGRRETAAPSIGWLIELVHSRANNPTSELQRQLDLVKTNLSAACCRLSDLERGSLSNARPPYATHEAHVRVEQRVMILEGLQNGWKSNLQQFFNRVEGLERAFEAVRVAFQSRKS